LVHEHQARGEACGPAEDRSGQTVVGSKSPRRYEVSAPARQRVADDELELPRLVSAVQGARAIVALQEQTVLGSALERKRYDGRGALYEGVVRDAFAQDGKGAKQGGFGLAFAGRLL
jgi:hypothetical protein